MADGEHSGATDALRTEVLKLFPTPVFVTTIPGAEVLNAELRQVILAREKTSEGVERFNRGGWQSSWDMHEWGGEPMRRLLSYARGIVDHATVDRTSKRHKITWRINSWANVDRMGHSHQLHTHPGGLWSVSYYVDDGGVDADRSLGGELEIADPRGPATVMYAPRLTFPGSDGLSLGESERLTPRAGAMIVFPSWLSHGVCPYRGTGERISIAINFGIVRP